MYAKSLHLKYQKHRRRHSEGIFALAHAIRRAASTHRKYVVARWVGTYMRPSTLFCEKKKYKGGANVEKRRMSHNSLCSQSFASRPRDWKGPEAAERRRWPPELKYIRGEAFLKCATLVAERAGRRLHSGLKPRHRCTQVYGAAPGGNRESVLTPTYARAFAMRVVSPHACSAGEAVVGRRMKFHAAAAAAALRGEEIRRR